MISKLPLHAISKTFNADGRLQINVDQNLLQNSLNIKQIPKINSFQERIDEFNNPTIEKMQ